MCNRLRSFRRHQINRLKNKRKEYWNGDNDSRTLGKIIQNPQICSKSCCGNPRKHFKKKTFQEIKKLKNMKEEEILWMNQKLI